MAQKIAKGRSKTASSKAVAAASSNNRTIFGFIALGVILILIAILVINNMNQNNQPSASSGEVGIEDIVVGDGAVAQSGDTVTVHYTGQLTDGTVFDSSVTRGQPFSFTIDAGDVIRGWDIGVAGMRVGGTRILTIPPEFGYGAVANGPIPANSTLIFEVQLLEIQ